MCFSSSRPHTRSFMFRLSEIVRTATWWPDLWGQRCTNQPTNKKKIISNIRSFPFTDRFFGDAFYILHSSKCVAVSCLFPRRPERKWNNLVEHRQAPDFQAFSHVARIPPNAFFFRSLESIHNLWFPAADFQFYFIVLCSNWLGFWMFSGHEKRNIHTHKSLYFICVAKKPQLHFPPVKCVVMTCASGRIADFFCRLPSLFDAKICLFAPRRSFFFFVRIEMISQFGHKKQQQQQQ